MEDKTLGMRWFKIYTVLFAVRVAIIAVSLVITIPLTIKNGLPSDSIEAARTVVYSIDYAFAIFAFIHFIKKTKLGYYLNLAYLVVGLVAAGIILVIRATVEEQEYPLIYVIVGSVLMQLLVIAAWFIPNYIYFKHRKFLFSGTLKEKSSLITSTVKSAGEKAKAISTKDPTSKQSTTTTNGNIPKMPIDNQPYKSIPSDDLRKLKELHQAGVLTDEEFSQKKKDILGI